jgi:pimeloyl-ACP methyl ester carboxylesterase
LKSTLHHVLSRDGTAVGWHDFPALGAGGAVDARPPIILTTGLGTTPNFWSGLVAALAPEHRVVRWDYRGHGDSEVSRGGDYSMATQADDLARVTLAALGERVDGRDHAPTPVVHVGFSMGVTVLLELYRRRPELVRAMVLIAGGADHPYGASALFQLPGVRAALQGALFAASPVVPRLSPVTRYLSKSRLLYPLGRALGALGPDAPRDEIEHFFRTVGAMDWGAYWSTLRALFDSHASDVLPTVSVPVLVIAPEHDVMAPSADLEQLRRSIPGAEWIQIPGTGHALLLEAGDAVAQAVRSFLRRLD